MVAQQINHLSLQVAEEAVKMLEEFGLCKTDLNC